MFKIEIFVNNCFE